MTSQHRRDETSSWSRSFRHGDQRSSNFWEITVATATVTTAWGRTGGKAQKRARTFASAEEAEAFAARVMREKLRKGYTERDHVRLEQISPRARAIGEHLRFVGTEGGPLLVLPYELLQSWHGVYDESGAYVFGTAPCDYERACEWRGEWVRSIRVGDALGLVMHSDGAGAWLPNDAGGIFVRWAAADLAAALVQAALNVTNTSWRGPTQRVTVGPSGKLALFDAARRGEELLTMTGDALMEQDVRWALMISLVPGTYAVHQIDSITGRLLNDAEPTDFATELTKLQRVR